VFFTWDPNKARSNLRVHGIRFDEAAETFRDPLAIVIKDLKHDDRWILIGASPRGRILYTVFVEFESDAVIRIISARRTTSHERRRYEEEQQ
jgi:hypothetical protein